GSSLATCVADAVAESAPAPVTLLFDAAATTAGSFGDQFTSTIETSADHLTAGEVEAQHEVRAVIGQLSPVRQFHYPTSWASTAAASAG
ncbi:hypothetical protein K7G98_39790, partial [Saccharothrix sp. MB29]|nr:hypothetical protein [Saccharothrix sp. MB29]